MKYKTGGKTPDRVVELLQQKIKETSILAVSKETGLSLGVVGRYANGIGEPRMANLQKLANYFNVTFTIEIKPEQKSP